MIKYNVTSEVFSIIISVKNYLKSKLGVCKEDTLKHIYNCEIYTLLAYFFKFILPVTSVEARKKLSLLICLFISSLPKKL